MDAIVDHISVRPGWNRRRSSQPLVQLLDKCADSVKAAENVLRGVNE